jgi:CBS domain-containing protein
MKIKDVMTRNFERAAPSEPVQSIARRMSRGDFGFIPVCDGDTVIGTVTDRDLAVRVVAAGLPVSTPVTEVMTRGATIVHEDDELEDVLDKMGDEQLRRFPVLDDLNEIVGVVSLGDLAACDEDRSGHTLSEISRPTPEILG